MKLSDLHLNEGNYIYKIDDKDGHRGDLILVSDVTNDSSIVVPEGVNAIQALRLVSGVSDLLELPPGTLLFLTHCLFSDAFTPDALFVAAVRSGVAGIVLTGLPDFTLTQHQRQILDSGYVFVLALPSAADFHRIVWRPKPSAAPSPTRRWTLLSLSIMRSAARWIWWSARIFTV